MSGPGAGGWFDGIDAREVAWRGASLAERRARVRGGRSESAGSAGGGEDGLLARWRARTPYASSWVMGKRLRHSRLSAAQFARLVAAAAPDAAAGGARPAPWVRRLAVVLGATWPAPASTDRAPVDWIGLVMPFVNDARARLVQRLEAAPPDGPNEGARVSRIADLLVPALAERIRTRVLRTFVLELNVARVRGVLHGATAQERYADFCASMNDRDARRRFFAEYVVLGRDLITVADAWVDATAELCRRFVADEPTIVRTLFGGVEQGAVTAVTAAGDTHRGGRCVHILTFASGNRLVYKPRALDVDTSFAALIEWFNARGLEPALAPPRVLDRGVYGWAEFVRTRTCASDAAVARFYERLGALLAVAYLLDASDMHLENVIADGEDPHIVDLEALFRPRVARAARRAHTSATAAGWQLLDESVATTGLLPVWTVGAPGAAIEVSGVGGAPDQLTVDRAVRFADAGTDTMRVVRERVTFGGAANRPRRADGRLVTPAAYADRIVAGFRRAYEIGLRYRDALTAPDGPVSRFASHRVRVVLRDTRVYALLLHESAHPDLQRDAAERDRHLDHLWAMTQRRPELRRVVEAELRELRAGDIPIFHARVDGTSLWSGDGREYREMLAESPLEGVRRRLGRLSDADCARQTWLITASMATLGTAGLHAAAGAPTAARPTSAPAVVPHPPVRRRSAERWRDTARWCAERLLATSVHDGAGAVHDATWLGLTLVGDDRWSTLPVGDDLYAGRSGIALFLAYAGEALALPAATALARTLVASIGRRTVRMLRAVPMSEWRIELGAFRTIGGCLYLLTQTGALWADAGLLHLATRIARRIDGAAVSDEELDLIGGSAGMVLALASLDRVLPRASTRAVIRRFADRLLASAVEQPCGGIAWTTAIVARAPLVGLSHGASGMALALSTAGALLDDRRYFRAARDAVRYEAAAYSASEHRWPDHRLLASPADERGMTAWCHGAPGIGLARLAMLATGVAAGGVGAELRHDVERAFAATLGVPSDGNHSLCHGAIGNLEFLARAAALLGDSAATEASARTEQVLEAIERGGIVCGVPGGVETPGLMTGLAGIGIGALRLAGIHRVPSPLLLEGSQRRAAHRVQ